MIPIAHIIMSNIPNWHIHCIMTRRCHRWSHRYQPDWMEWAIRMQRARTWTRVSDNCIYDSWSHLKANFRSWLWWMASCRHSSVSDICFHRRPIPLSLLPSRKYLNVIIPSAFGYRSTWDVMRMSTIRINQFLTNPNAIEIWHADWNILSFQACVRHCSRPFRRSRWILRMIGSHCIQIQ